MRCNTNTGPMYTLFFLLWHLRYLTSTKSLWHHQPQAKYLLSDTQPKCYACVTWYMYVNDHGIHNSIKYVVTLYKRLYLVEPLWKLRLPLDGIKCHLLHLLIINSYTRGTTTWYGSANHISYSWKVPKFA